MDLTFLPVLSVSSSVCEEHGVSCVNFLAIVTLLHTTLTVEMSRPAFCTTFPGVGWGTYVILLFFSFVFVVFNIIHFK